MATLTWQQILPNVFLIQNGEKGVVYNPLLGKFFSVNAEGFVIINDYLQNGLQEKHIFHEVLLSNGLLASAELPKKGKEGKFSPREVTLSLSSGCNLRCIYCYAHGGVNSKVLPWQAIVQSVNQLFIFTKESGEQEAVLSFHGTGEALTQWNTLIETVEYAQEKLPAGLKLKFALVTNGTLIDDAKAQWLKNYDFAITVSMDGLEETQNKQRPKADGSGSYQDVVNGIKALVKVNANFAVRCTITGKNQSEMVDFLRLCASLGCKDVSVVPFSSTGRGEVGVESIDPIKFIQSYIRAQEKAKELGVRFSTPSGSLNNVSARYCDGDGNIFAVMPCGSISSCTRVTRQEDSLASKFFIGKIDEKEGACIFQEKVETLKSLNLYSFPGCQDCYAKFSCCGGCHHTRLINGGVPEDYCKIIRGVIWYHLEKLAF